MVFFVFRTLGRMRVELNCTLPYVLYGLDRIHVYGMEN